MKSSSIACAGFVVLAALAITADVAYAQSQTSGVNTSRSNVKNNSPINPSDPNSVKSCKDAGGKVTMVGGHSVCRVPTVAAEGVAPCNATPAGKPCVHVKNNDVAAPAGVTAPH